MLQKIKCFFGYCEHDLWVAGFCKNLQVSINKHFDTDWGGWFKIPYDEFGLSYYLQCKHCGRGRK